MGDSIWLAEELEERNEELYYGYSDTPLEEIDDWDEAVQRRASTPDYSDIIGFFR